jgi:hypothetical protein
MTDQEIVHELLSIASLLTRSKGDREDNVWRATTRIGALAARMLEAKDPHQSGAGKKHHRRSDAIVAFEASRWISLRLAAGPVPRAELAAEAQREGFTAAMIARAMEELDVKLSLGPDGRLIAASLGDAYNAKKNGSTG